MDCPCIEKNKRTLHIGCAVGLHADVWLTFLMVQDPFVEAPKKEVADKARKSLDRIKVQGRGP